MMDKNQKKNKLVLDATPQAVEYIEQLWKSGELEQLLGASVSNIIAWENLSQWFNDVLDSSWEIVPNSRRISSYKTVPVTRAKIINLDGKSVAIVISIKQTEQQKTDVIVKIEPTSYQVYLPEKLKLIVTDEWENKVAQAQAGTRDNWVQLELQCLNKTKFIVQVILENTIITENFVIERLEKQSFDSSTETELIFNCSVNHEALTAAIKKVQAENKITELSIQKIEVKEDNLVSVILQITPETNQEKIKKDIEKEYQTILEGEDRIILSTSKPDLVQLTGWFEGWFIGGWQPEGLAHRLIKEESSMRQPDGISNDLLEVKATKVFKLEKQMPERPIALEIHQREITSSRIEIRLRLYPASNSIYLPDGVQLIVLDESGKPISELKAQARVDDNWLQLKFTASSGDRFSTRVVLGNESMTENFII